MKQLFKQIYNERRSNAFLWIELLLVFVVLWYIVDLVYVTLHVYYQPMGFNIENTYILRMNRLTDKSTEFNPELTIKDDIIALKKIADRLSHRPEVESVCISQNSIPYNEGCSGASFRFPDNDTVWVGTMDRWATPEYYKVFRFRNVDGSGHESLVKALEKNTIIVPVDVADYYPNATFHGKDLLGKEVRMGDANNRIAALTEPVRYDHFSIAGKPYTGTYIGTYLSDEQLDTFGNVAYLELSLRVHEGTDNRFMERLMDDADRLYQVGNVYILDISPLSKVRVASEIDNENELRTQFCILFFLLLNIFLGVIGTFWFRTQQRRSEVALRMAMGADRRNIFRRLIMEGISLLTMSAVPAILITFNIGYAELVDISQMPFTISRFLIATLLTYFLMVVMIFFGVLYPALQAMKVQPAEALRDE